MMARRGLFLATALASSGAIALVACDSGDDPDPRPPVADAGTADAADMDAAEPRDTNDAGFDADAILVDAGPPPIVCTVTPCAVEIAAGAHSTCVRLTDGTVQCWGSNASGELGRGPDAPNTSATPARVAGLSDVTQISGSPSDPTDVYCARRDGGGIACWGSNARGVLGRASDAGVEVESSPTAWPVSRVDAATGVFVGAQVGCATGSGNDLVCWGSNETAQLPNHVEPDGPYPAASFTVGAPVVQLAISDRGTLALTSSRRLLSWGLGGDLLGPGTGVLGREVSLERAAPGEIDLAHVSTVAASVGRACAIANGRVYCWGAGPTKGSDSVYPTPVGVGGSIAFAQTIAVGPRTACTTLSDGSAYCWGDNSRGQLGSGDTELKPVPVRVQGLAGKPVRMAVMDASTCAILASGAVQCWGQNDRGQLGNGATDALTRLAPTNVELSP